MIHEEIPAKLKGALVKKFHLINEAQVIEKIEKAVSDYYDLSMDDISNIKEVNYDAYVYIYMHPKYTGKWHIYGNEYIYNKPLYVGKGTGDRKESHLRYSHNSELDIAIKSLADKGLEPIIKIYNDGCTGEMALNLENYIIARLREQDIQLCNATHQNNSLLYNKNIVITAFNVETIRNALIIDALNSTRSRRECAKLLGISDRTLYRKIKSLGIIKEYNIYRFKDKLSLKKKRHKN